MKWQTAKCNRAVKSNRPNGVGRKNECYPQRRYGGCEQGTDIRMKSPKYYLYLSENEYRLLFHTLVEFKNKLHREGRYTDTVDEVLIKISKAKQKKFRMV